MDCQDVVSAISGFSLVADCSRIDNEVLRLATPFHYPDGSLIDVFVVSDPSRLPQVPSFIVSDLGQTTANLLDMHIKTWTTKKRKQAVADVCTALGVTQRGGEFIIELASLGELSDAIVRLSQACIRVSDLIFTQRISAPVSFRDDVEEFLASADMAYEPEVLVPGKFSRDVQVDFRVRGNHVESLILTLATGSSAAAHPLSNEVFRKWHDLEKLRTSHQFLSVFDSRTNQFREDDLARLADVSTVLGFPDQQDAIRAAVAA